MRATTLLPPAPPLLRLSCCNVSGGIQALVLLLTLFVSYAALAEDATEPEEKDEPIAYVDAPRDYLGRRIADFAQTLDGFFGNNTNYQEANKSVVQLDLSHATGQMGDRQNHLAARAKVDLPHTQERLHLMFETNPDQRAADETKLGQTAAPAVTPGNQSYAAALRVERAKSDEEVQHWHSSADAGVHLEGGSRLNPFTRLRGSYTLPLDDWNFKASESLFWFHTTGAGATTQIDFEHIISKPMLFRATSLATFLHTKQNFDLREDFSLYYNRSERQAMLFQASAVGITRPQAELSDLVLLMNYRYRVHRKWVFLEIGPQLHFPRARNFHETTLLTVKLEFLLDGTE